MNPGGSRRPNRSDHTDVGDDIVAPSVASVATGGNVESPNYVHGVQAPVLRPYAGTLFVVWQKYRSQHGNMCGLGPWCSLVAKWAILTQRRFVVFTNFYD